MRLDYKSIWQTSRHWTVHCLCGSLPHQAVFMYFPDDPPIERDLYLTILLPRAPWHERVRSAWRLLWGRVSTCGDTSEMLLNPDEVRALQAFLADYLRGFDDTSQP